MNTLTLTLAASMIAGALASASHADPPASAKAFLADHCVKCHGRDKQKGDVRLDDLTADMSRDGDRWLLVADQLRDGTMPPKKEARPDERRARELIAWIAAAGVSRVARLPNQGNLIPHEALFAAPVPPTGAAAAATPPRVWRLGPDAYLGYVRDLARGNIPGIVQPFTLIPERGIRDFASLYSIDEQSTLVLLRNAQLIVDRQAAHDVKDGRVSGKNDSVREFVALMDPAAPPKRDQLLAALQYQFRTAVARPPTEEETARYLALYDRCARAGDTPGAARTMLQAVILRADAMYRVELGSSQQGGRAMLAPPELARAVSLALTDRRDALLTQAAAKGELVTREQVAAHVRRILDDPKVDKPQLLRFFRQYFEYQKAPDIFKERPADRIKHVPDVLVADTDRLVLHVLNTDKDVFRQLLTTPLSFVNTRLQKNRQMRVEELVPADVIPKPDPKAKRPPEWVGGVNAVYGFAEWPVEQPVTLPEETRLGILMQPSWLVAWSTNFDNDVVRRGRWIRERLLGGTVPDLPIGVVAQVPDEKHRTFRDRLTVTHQEQCWKCHRRMDDLGLPFEQFDHYGRFRTAEKVLDPEATAKNLDKKGNPLGPVLRDAPLDTTGRIADSGDPKLDGPVKDPREFVRRLADSERVRQVFVRHAFRYFLGRNESLTDAATLQAADRAYTESGGSFKALVLSLLTSDSFLYRSAPPVATATGARP